MRIKHSYLGHSICLRRIKEGHLQVEGDEEGKESEDCGGDVNGEKKRNNLTNPR